MSTRQGLVLLDGGKAHKAGKWLVVKADIIMSMVGMLQLGQPRGVSLNQLHKVLDRVREGKPRVDWYALRDSLSYLENDGRLKTHKVRKGNLHFSVYELADWEEWWRVHSRLLG